MQYLAEDLVRLAKRDNNSLRPYLYVNPLQGKHIPTSPKKVFELSKTIASMINIAHPYDSLYIIGFAETATGIAAAVSCFLENVKYYQNTTREYIDGQDFISFTESHSHATDQMLRAERIESCLHKITRIIFIDDEVTTGNTIIKLINKIKDRYDIGHIKFTIVSIVNSMKDERIKELRDLGIDCISLASIPFEYKKDSIMEIPFIDELHTVVRAYGMTVKYKEINYSSDCNARSVVNFKEYQRDHMDLANKIKHELGGYHCKDILILGTEEFMYSGLCIGKVIEDTGISDEVRFHATTRSPIIAYNEVGYPLNHRYQIRSLYDSDRVTYLYNLDAYEKVFISSDASFTEEGLYDLCSALYHVGNRDITIVRWRYDRDY